MFSVLWTEADYTQREGPCQLELVNWSWEALETMPIIVRLWFPKLVWCIYGDSRTGHLKVRHHGNSRMVISNVGNKSHSQSEQKIKLSKNEHEISAQLLKLQHTGLVFKVPTAPLPPSWTFCFPKAPQWVTGFGCPSSKGLNIQIKCFFFSILLTKTSIPSQNHGHQSQTVLS